MPNGDVHVDRFETEVRTAYLELRHPAAKVIGLVPLILCICAFALQSLVPLAFVYGWLLGLVAFLQLWRPLRTLAIDGEGAHLNGKQMMARNEIASAVAYQDTASRCHVAIAPRARWSSGGVFQLDVPDMTSARSIVRALDLPRDDFFRTKILDAFAIALASVCGVLLALAFTTVTGAGLVWTLGFVWAFLSAGLSVVNRRMLVGTAYTVGNDGVRIGKLFRERFIPFSKIEAIDRNTEELGMRIRLHFGERRPLVVSGAQADRVVQLHMKISEALERYRLHAVGDKVPEDLERGDRTAHEWLTSLRSIRPSSTTQYRVASTSPSDLARVLTDQSADVAARAASAIALDAIDHAAAQRIRDVAAHTANPKLRVALESIANHEGDDEIGQHLEALSGRARG